MRLVWGGFVALVALRGAAYSTGAEYEILRTMDGPFETPQKYGSAHNSGSSLVRQSVILNARGCPVKITNHTGKLDSTYGMYSTRINVEFGSPVVAVEIFTNLYDVWGQQTDAISAQLVTDIDAGETRQSSGLRTSDKGISSLTAVAYVSRVRLADGVTWVVDSDGLASALAGLDLARNLGLQPHESDGYCSSAFQSRVGIGALL